MVETEAVERFVKTRKNIRASAELSVGARPHIPTGLRRNDQLVAVGLEVSAQHPAEVLLSRPLRRPVVVGQIEMGDPPLERGPQNLTLQIKRRLSPKL